ncbi:MAG: hypothetical protein WCC29_07225 [Pseudomonas farsensis]|uniref:hypothetical protein n=1 Tax=Pseudomonas farsensis TaxID=2745492 RepID=UPI003C7DE0AA
MKIIKGHSLLLALCLTAGAPFALAATTREDQRPPGAPPHDSGQMNGAGDATGSGTPGDGVGSGSGGTDDNGTDSTGGDGTTSGSGNGSSGSGGNGSGSSGSGGSGSK